MRQWMMAAPAVLAMMLALACDDGQQPPLPNSGAMPAAEVEAATGPATTPVPAAPHPAPVETNEPASALVFVPTPTTTPTPVPHLRWDTPEADEASRESLRTVGIRIGAAQDPDGFYTLLTTCGGPIPVRDALLGQFIPAKQRFLDGTGTWRFRNDPNNAMHNVGPVLQVGMSQLRQDGRQFITWSIKAIKSPARFETRPPDVDFRGVINDECHVHLESE